MANTIHPTKKAVVTVAIDAGLICPVDGQIFSTSLERDLTDLLRANGYSMDPKKAVKLVSAFCKRKEEAAYG